MPNIPSPYDMPDWKKVTLGYDSLVFDLAITGDFLPLIFINNNTVNYPGHNSFGLHSYVGTDYPLNGETINVIPSVIGATLCGIDKSNQKGYDWVLMCEEYFNRRPEENVYLNNPVSSSGSDFWYDTMPNIFFYQLYSLYPGMGDFDYQFTKIADRWLEAIEHMRGSTTPWRSAIVFYRGWYLSSMTGNANGVLEPEAAGALGWLLYNCYIVTGEEKYRIGAEWVLEFLSSLSENPSYELQLSYGAYIAARMNAELLSNYDINKILNWCFDVGPLREWGVILGKWGEHEVNGLVGEVNGQNDYAFLMNTFEQIGALAPLVRYDDRYARAIGKWILNAANSARLFYSKYLPDNHQDSEDWSQSNDPNSYIGYEALRQILYGQSPYATGDAIGGGWAETNLGLYGSSHVGILGGIIEKTNEEKILKIDLLKTDYFHSPAYPSYLFYNPFSESKQIQFDLPPGTYDLYDAVSNTFLQRNSSGSANISLPGDNSIILVLTPAGGTVEYELNKMFIDEVVADYNSGQTVDNHPPRIKAVAPDNNIPLVNSDVKIYCTAVDIDGDNIFHSWNISGQKSFSDSSTIDWVTPSEAGIYEIECSVSDDYGMIDSYIITVEVFASINNPPVIEKIKASPRKLNLNETAEMECFASDEDDDDLSYIWTSDYGHITGSGKVISWTAPAEAGNYFIMCHVNDGIKESAKDSLEVMVRDLSIHNPGNLVAFYPFSGNTSDASGNSMDGTNHGALYISDRFGNGGSALKFDGTTDYVSVPNDPLLNFQNAISVSFWMQANELFDREMYPLSHGNWENRWKVSISNNRVRWTINTNTGIKDLDSESQVQQYLLYHVVVVYTGVDVELYLNGELDAFSSFSGYIKTTNYDFTIAQILPGNSQYNFKGVLDDIRIYDYALSLEEIDELYDFNVDVNEEENNLPSQIRLLQNFPNPFNGQTQIEYHLNIATKVDLIIYDILGRKIKQIESDYKNPGRYIMSWDAKDGYGNELSSGVYFITMRTNDFVNTKKLLLLR